MTATANLAQALIGGSAPTPADVPIDYLDYEHISKCTNGKELEKILKVLRSGKEGRWPDLERHCEARLSQVLPKSKLLRLSTNLLKPGSLDDNTRQDMDQDINEWLNSMHEKDGSLKKSKNITSAPLPNIRQSGQVDTDRKSEAKSTETKSNPDRINSYDYRSWDRYDPDQECEKIDTAAEKVKPRPGPAQPAPATSVNAQALSDSKELAAQREKDKGNEAFKAGDYEESINYYSNSIEIHPLAATYNNRGLAEIRLERYFKAIDDFNCVLEREPDNVKALLRRADAREKLGQIKEGHADLKRSVIVDENNKRAKQLLDEYTERHKKMLTKGGKRMKIVESSDEEDSPPKPASPGKPAAPAAPSDPAPPATPEPVKVPCTRDEPKVPEREVIEILPLPEKVAKLKQEASAMFANGHYGDCIAKYTECVEALDKSKPGYRYHHALLLSNRAACKLKVGQCVECIKDCTESVQINPRFFKSVLRRAIAYENVENFKKSYEDYRLTIVMDPTQVTAQQGVARLSEVLRRKYGTSWREQVSDHATAPAGPEFIDPAAKKNLPQQPANISKPESNKSQPLKNKDTTSKAPQEKAVPKKEPAKPAQKQESAKPPQKQETPKQTAPQKDPPKPAPQTANQKPAATNKIPTREEQYSKFKDQGNKYVAKQEYRDALRCYEKCITIDKTLVPAHLNSALCHLKLGNYTKAVECSEKVLSVEAGNIKALYRRAAANKELGKFQQAAKDLKFVVEKDPGNKPAVQLLEQVKKLWSNQLRGIQTPAPSGPQKAAPKKSGKKIPIVPDSESDDSETDDAKQEPEPEQKRERAVPKEAESTAKKEPSKAAGSTKDGNKGSKPWMKKNAAASSSGVSEVPTAFSFLQHWSAYKKKKDITQFAKVLESCDPNSFPKLFSSSIDADMVIAIVDAVDKYFIPSQQHDKALEILQAVTRVQRFDVMTMLMSSKDKATISDVINRLAGDSDVLKTLHSRFS